MSEFEPEGYLPATGRVHWSSFNTDPDWNKSRRWRQPGWQIEPNMFLLCRPAAT